MWHTSFKLHIQINMSVSKEIFALKKVRKPGVIKDLASSLCVLQLQLPHFCIQQDWQHWLSMIILKYIMTMWYILNLAEISDTFEMYLDTVTYTFDFQQKVSRYSYIYIKICI